MLTRRRPRALLFDRDGTLVHDVPYNGDPGRVVLAPGAAAAMAATRAAGARSALVTNQRGVALGLLDESDVNAVNERVATLVGGIDVLVHCPHDDRDGCSCRKPLPGLVHAALGQLGVAPEDAVMFGDTIADVEAAMASGVIGVLVPNAATRRDEVVRCPIVFGRLDAAVRAALSGSLGRHPAIAAGSS